MHRPCCLNCSDRIPEMVVGSECILSSTTFHSAFQLVHRWMHVVLWTFKPCKPHHRHAPWRRQWYWLHATNPTVCDVMGITSLWNETPNGDVFTYLISQHAAQVLGADDVWLNADKDDVIHYVCPCDLRAPILIKLHLNTCGLVDIKHWWVCCSLYRHRGLQSLVRNHTSRIFPSCQISSKMTNIYIFYSPHCSGRRSTHTGNTTKQKNKQIEKHTNGSDISHNMSSS